MHQERFTYYSCDDTELTLTLISQNAPSASKRLPCVVLFEPANEKHTADREMTELASALAQAGIAAVIATYRQSAGGIKRIPRQAISDARAAVRAVRQQAKAWGIDGRHIAALGDSGAGHIALMSAIGPQWDDEAVGSDSPSARTQAVIALRTLFDWESPVDGSVLLPERQAISPQRCASAEMPPLLILHGADDEVAPLAQVEQFVDQARQSGARHITSVFLDHGAQPLHLTDESADAFAVCVAQTTVFLKNLGWFAASQSDSPAPTASFEPIHLQVEVPQRQAMRRIVRKQRNRRIKHMLGMPPRVALRHAAANRASAS